MILMTIYCRWYNIKWSKTLELSDLECDISSNSSPFNNGVPLKPSFRCLEDDFTPNIFNALQQWNSIETKL